MIIDRADIMKFETEWIRCDPANDPYQLRLFMSWLSENPQVFMAAGFQEFVPISQIIELVGDLYYFGVIDKELPLFRTLEGSWIHLYSCGQSKRQRWEGYRIEALKSGLAQHIDWLVENGDIEAPIEIETFEQAHESLPCFNSIVAAASALVDNPLMDKTKFVSPRLWTLGNQMQEKLILENSTRDILKSLQSEEKTIEDLHWKQLEEIVAEILRAQGMEIHLVRESPQGGRDILGRTKMSATGELLTIAVEVKHRSVVNRPDVELALQQNAHFPALMFVTSGVFSTGVIQEAKKPENRMRLLLRDGVAVRDLIRSYRLK